MCYNLTRQQTLFRNAKKNSWEMELKKSVDIEPPRPFFVCHDSIWLWLLSILIWAMEQPHLRLYLLFTEQMKKHPRIELKQKKAINWNFNHWFARQTNSPKIPANFAICLTEMPIRRSVYSWEQNDKAKKKTIHREHTIKQLNKTKISKWKYNILTTVPPRHNLFQRILIILFFRICLIFGCGNISCYFGVLQYVFLPLFLSGALFGGWCLYDGYCMLIPKL